MNGSAQIFAELVYSTTAALQTLTSFCIASFVAMQVHSALRPSNSVAALGQFGLWIEECMPMLAAMLAHGFIVPPPLFIHLVR